MFTENFTIKYKYRDMFSSGEYIVTINNNTRINDNIPIDFYNLLGLLLHMQNRYFFYNKTSNLN